MSRFHILVAAIFCLLGEFTWAVQSEPIICPPDDSASGPCTCSITESQPSGVVECVGPNVTNMAVQTMFEKLRQLNNLSSNELLIISQFDLESTNMTQLDLTPLLNTRIDFMYIIFNYNLTGFEGPSLDNSNATAGLIDVTHLAMYFCALTDEGFGEALKYFSPQMESLRLYNNNLTGNSITLIEDGSGDLEFLPGLGALTNLDSLDLSGNRIQSLRGRSFKRNGKLTALTLDGNRITEYADEALFFGRETDPVAGRVGVGFNGQGLTHEAFLPNNGLDLNTRQLSLQLGQNAIETLPREVFEPILDAYTDEPNYLSLSGNPLICDGRVKWLKDRRDEFEGFVFGADCSNDPGKTIFTSSLVS